MFNITQKLEWNNHKDMNSLRLINEFMKLTLTDRVKVYKFLSEKRRRLLRKSYDGWKKKNDEKNLRLEIELLTKSLSDFIDINEIKTYDEALLTFAIMAYCSDITHYGYEKNPNQHKEKDSFERSKNKMIVWLQELDKRLDDEIEFLGYDNLIIELKQVNYIEPKTKNEYFKIQKELWKRLYKHINVGKERGELIVKALAKRIQYIDSLAGFNYREKEDDENEEWFYDVTYNIQTVAYNLLDKLTSEIYIFESDMDELDYCPQTTP